MRTFVRISSLAFALLFTRELGAQQLNYTFQTYKTGLGLWYTGAQLVDMDGDGAPEVLVGNRAALAVEIWKYNPSLGNLQLADSVGFGGEVHDIQAADFNHDNKRDLVVAIRGGGIRLRLNQSGGLPAVWAPATTLIAQYGWQVLAADFDGDSHLDLFAGLDFCCAHVLYGTGTGAFSTDVSLTVTRGLGFNAIDVNHDGKLDLMGPDGYYGGQFRVFLNGGASRTWQAVFNPLPSPPVPLWQLSSYATPSAGDVDGDGYIDQVAFTLSTDWFSPPQQFWLLKGGSSGGNLTWNMQPIDGPFNYQASPYGIFDLNQDGKLDLYYAGGRGTTGFKAFFGDGLGHFTTEFLPLDHGFEHMNSFAFGDINRDGVLDVLALRFKNGANDGFEVWYGVQPNQPPVANAGPDQTVECATAGGAAVTLNGSGSYDPDNDAITYQWTGPFGSAAGVNPVVTLALGTHNITLTVRDAKGATDTDTLQVTVRDTQPPALTVVLTPNVLWPPNHKMVAITAGVTATDACSAPVSVTLVSITMNEGDVSDIEGATYGTDDRRFSLRAERLGTGTSRVYTVTYQARDASANVRTAAATVTVPHNQ